MEIIKINSSYQSHLSDEYVVAIGNFDGIHKAHESILRLAKKIAKEQNKKFGVMTFDTTPKKIINDIDNYFILRSQSQKFDILEELGVQAVFLLEFDKNFKNIIADDFVQRFIINNGIKYIVCGYDWRFGKDKEGCVNFLLKYDKQVKTVVVPQEKIEDLKIGSTYIHQLILNGEVDKANEILTKPYSMIGQVVHGNKKGRLIGFPTANLACVDNYRIPAIGVYATKTMINGQAYLSMTNIGHNPTFNYNNNIRIETNIFDYQGDLYQDNIEIVFYKYIRKEMIFDGVDQLIKQLNKDKEKVLSYFAEHPNE